MGSSSIVRVVLIAGVAGMGAVPACLPAGTPPTGRHLLAGRNTDSVTFVAGPVGQPSLLLLSQEQVGQDGFPRDDGAWALSTVDDSGAEGLLPAARVLLENATLLACGNAAVPGAPCDPQTDSLGRLYLSQNTYSPSVRNPGGTDGHSEVFRVDPASGARVSLGAVGTLRLSDDRTRTAALMYSDDPMIHQWIVRDAQDAEVTFSGLSNSQFIGNDFYFVSDDHQLMHLPPAGQVEPLLSDVSYFTVTPTERGPLLFPTHSMPVRSTSLFDGNTFVDTSLPLVSAAGTTFTPSPLGRYVAVRAAVPADQTKTLGMAVYDRDTAQETVLGPFDSNLIAAASWRPGSEELWFRLGDRVWYWKPGQEVVDFASWRGMLPIGGRFNDLFFTTDGRYWLGTDPWIGEKIVVYVRSADDAAAPPFRVNPQGTGLTAVWRLGDGRLVVEDSISDVRRNDIYLVTPDASTLQPLASGGNIVAVGRSRCLALLHWAASGVGDLTLIDFATGAQTLLAQNVQVVAVDKAAASPDDFLAPGAGVAYVVSGRFASPFDGLWLTTLP